MTANKPFASLEFSHLRGEGQASKPLPFERVASPALGIGASGPEVAFLQLRINALQGDEALAVDGLFGEETQNAVIRIQCAFGLTPTGVYDQTTARLCLARCAALSLLGGLP